MRIVQFADPPGAELAQGLEQFERQFTYPLGPGRSFSIEHGDDYVRFYRAIGDAQCFVSLAGQRVLGVVCVALRPLFGPDGAVQRVAYLGDLKVARDARFGLALYQLFRAGEEWGRPHADAAYGVVMDGTSLLPTRYTGRAGIPALEVAGKVMVLRFLCENAPLSDCQSLLSTEAVVREQFRRLSAGRYAAAVGTPSLRSHLEPVWLTLPDGSACGCLEDTRRAKRLIADDGQELVSADLSCLAYRTLEAGAGLIRVAAGLAAELRLPALFVSVAASDARAIQEVLADLPVVVAPATIYAHGLPTGHSWNISSSEI